MAKKPEEAPKPQQGSTGGSTGNGQTPTLNVLAQYVKDFSFESPGAPQSLRNQQKAPGIKINVNVNANPIADAEYDVNLTLQARAEAEGKVLFNVELPGGIPRRRLPQSTCCRSCCGMPAPAVPFARQIVADATRNGGFPPLLLDPIDFAQMFQKRMPRTGEVQRSGELTAGQASALIVWGGRRVFRLSPCEEVQPSRIEKD